MEAQRADLEAAIRRLEQSLAEARQDLLDFDGETYLSVDKKMGRWFFISGQVKEQLPT